MSEKRKKTPQDTAGQRSVPEWLAQRLDFPPDVMSGGMRIELRGREALLVQGCRRILTYTPTLVRLKLPRGILAIRGERLLCHAYLAGAVGLEGRVQALSFEDEEDTPC